MRSVFDACPSCKDVKVESVPISFDETYRLDYDTKRGYEIEPSMVTTNESVKNVGFSNTGF
jgi:hypothetical protein